MCCRCGRAQIKAENALERKESEYDDAKSSVQSTRISIYSASERIERHTTPHTPHPCELNFDFAKSNSFGALGTEAPSQEMLIENTLKTILGLCQYARIFEAHDILTKLLSSIDESGQALVQQKINLSPALSKLESTHSAMLLTMALTLTPGLRQDVTWTNLDLKDPSIGENFRLEMSLRLAQGAEVEKGGPASQVILRAQLYNFPLSLEQFMLMQVEVDLVRREWIKDCEAIRAWCGGDEKLFQSLVQVLVAPPLLPVRLQECFLRRIAVCDEPPFKSSLSNVDGPGVLYSETNPPEGATEFEGWKLPDSLHKRALALKGTVKMFYAMSSQDHPDCTDLLTVARIGVPAPQWMIPLSLLKRVCADILHQSFKMIKQKVIDHWQDYDFNDRAAKNPLFYRQLFETSV